ncbi:hypothetical protein Z946_3786 [Sulfitobacter noctilucicola]|nr:hypothetical protein Z946_3786 [Sulfitobacter noctilucicola]
MPQLLGKLRLRELCSYPNTDQYLSLNCVLHVLLIVIHFLT